MPCRSLAGRGPHSLSEPHGAPPPRRPAAGKVVGQDPSPDLPQTQGTPGAQTHMPDPGLCGFAWLALTAGRATSACWRALAEPEGPTVLPRKLGGPSGPRAQPVLPGPSGTQPVAPLLSACQRTRRAWRRTNAESHYSASGLPGGSGSPGERWTRGPWFQARPGRPRVSST